MLQSHRVISPIINLNFEGWQSNTLVLQQCGWEISSQQDHYGMNLRLALRNQKCHLVFYSNQIDFSVHQFDSGRFNKTAPINQVVSENTTIMIQGLRGGGDFLQNYNPIDAIPQIVEMKEISYKDIDIFKKSITRTDEIIVNPEEVGMWMRKIKESQSPKQKEIRENIRRGRLNLEAVPEHTVHAQIISLAA